MEYVVTKFNPFFKEGLIIKKHGSQWILECSEGIQQRIILNEVVYVAEGWIKKVEKPILTKSESAELVRYFDILDNPKFVNFNYHFANFCKENNIECE
jgi:hypothetical protein